MKQEYVAIIALFSFSSCIFHVYGQDIIYPGETERPPRYPLNPNNPNNPNNNPNNNSNNPNNNPNNNSNNPNNNSNNPNNNPNNSNNNLNNPNNNPNNPNNNSNNTIGGITQEQYNACVNDCKFTAEYNPKCGSDGVIYQNLGALNCAVYCGNPIRNLGTAPCDQYFSTTPASG